LQIRKKVLVLIEEWGKKFERDHDIMPLFSDVYKALQKKGIEFPSSSSSVHSPDKGFAQPSQEAGSPMKEKKLVSDLPPKY